MFPDPMIDVALFELEQRIRLGDVHRHGRECERSRTKGLRRLRWVLGSLLLRLGNVVLGEAAWFQSDSPRAN